MAVFASEERLADMALYISEYGIDVTSELPARCDVFTTRYGITSGLLIISQGGSSGWGFIERPVAWSEGPELADVVLEEDRRVVEDDVVPIDAATALFVSVGMFCSDRSIGVVVCKDWTVGMDRVAGPIFIILAIFRAIAAVGTNACARVYNNSLLWYAACWAIVRAATAPGGGFTMSYSP